MTIGEKGNTLAISLSVNGVVTNKCLPSIIVISGKEIYCAIFAFLAILRSIPKFRNKNADKYYIFILNTFSSFGKSVQYRILSFK